MHPHSPVCRQELEKSKAAVEELQATISTLELEVKGLKADLCTAEDAKHGLVREHAEEMSAFLEAEQENLSAVKLGHAAALNTVYEDKAEALRVHAAMAELELEASRAETRDRRDRLMARAIVNMTKEVRVRELRQWHLAATRAAAQRERAKSMMMELDR